MKVLKTKDQDPTCNPTDEEDPFLKKFDPNMFLKNLQ